ncbi:MAG: lipocalin-like domain-containing protein [Gammaproteobacteria bacterium]|nr:lipocalin-like domain-containing protein [Gammaproteobacteria bacterium]
MSSQQFLGTWKLVSAEMVSDADVIYPLGKNCQGIITFDEAGKLIGHMMNADRPEFAGNDMLGGRPHAFDRDNTGVSHHDRVFVSFMANVDRVALKRMKHIRFHTAVEWFCQNFIGSNIRESKGLSDKFNLLRSTRKVEPKPRLRQKTSRFSNPHSNPARAGEIGTTVGIGAERRAGGNIATYFHQMSFYV